MSKPDAKRRYRARRRWKQLVRATALGPEHVNAALRWWVERHGPIPDKRPKLAWLTYSPAIAALLRRDTPETVRFTPIVNGQLGDPLYPCGWCGKLIVHTRNALCDDCIPF